MNLVKLCVGVESVDDHRRWIEFRLKQLKAAGMKPEQFHTTRMFPKRADEIIGQGSLYWVTKGRIQSRQKVLDIRRFVDDGGIKRCDIVLEPELILTTHQPKRPFQGWRYLKPEDAPRDLTEGELGIADMPEDMRQDLASLGLI